MVLRELFVKIGFDVDEKGLKNAEVAVHRFIEKLVDNGIELAKEFAESLKGAVEYGDKIKKASQSIGIATDALQELQYAGSLADVSAEEMAQSIGILSRKMLEAKQGSEEAGKAFKGIKFQEKGKLLATDEVLGNIADKFQQMPDGAEKTAMAMQLFGRAGKQMIPLLNKGSEELEALKQEAKDFGLVLGDDAVNASEELNDNLKRLHMIGQGLLRQVIGPLIPVASELVEKFLEWRKANAKILAQKIDHYMATIVKWTKIVGEDIFVIGKTLYAVAKVVGETLVGAFNNLGSTGKAVFTVIGIAIAAAMSPLTALMAIVSAIMLVIDDIRGYHEGEDSLYGTFIEEIKKWTEINPEDGALLKGIKKFISLIREAIDSIEEMQRAWDDAFGEGSKTRDFIDQRAGKNSSQIQAESDVQTLRTARRRVSMGQPLSDAEKEALQRTGLTEQAFTARYMPTATPEARSSGASNSSMSINAPMSVVINPPAGSSSEDIGNAVTEKMNEFWNTQMEAASAGVSR